jgi:hypothetical protein
MTAFSTAAKALAIELGDKNRASNQRTQALAMVNFARICYFAIMFVLLSTRVKICLSVQIYQASYIVGESTERISRLLVHKS